MCLKVNKGNESHELAQKKHVWASRKYIMDSLVSQSVNVRAVSWVYTLAAEDLLPCSVSDSRDRSKKKQSYEYLYCNVVSIMVAQISLSLSLPLWPPPHNYYDVSNKGVYISINKCYFLLIPAIQQVYCIFIFSLWTFLVCISIWEITECNWLV